MNYLHSGRFGRSCIGWSVVEVLYGVTLPTHSKECFRIQCFCVVMDAIVHVQLILVAGDRTRMDLTHARLVRLAVVIFIISIAGVAVALPRSVKADSSSPLDGVGQGPCNSAAPVINCSTQLLSTTQSNDVVIVVAEGTNSTTVSDSSGLSFVQRVSYSSTTYPPLTMVEFYAVAASPLNSDNITVSDAPRYTNGMQAFAIHGADTAALFDQDPSIPATVSCPGPDCGNCYADYNTNPGTCSASIQTSASDFVVATTAINDALPCGGYPTSPAGYVPPPGFAHILASDTFEVDYTLSANPPNSVEFECNATDASAIVLDAIVMSSATSPSGLDGSGVYVNCSGQTTFNASSDTFYRCSSESISTTHGNDEIILLATSGGQTPGIDSITDQNGLSFTQRYALSLNGNRTESTLWEYYAFAPMALTGDNITVAFSMTQSFVGIHVLAVHGVDPSAVFDPDPSLPSATPCEPFGPQPVSCSTTFSTSAQDLVIASIPINDMAGCPVPPGFATNLETGGWWEVDNTIFPSAQSNYTFSCSSSSTQDTQPLAMAVDAIMLTPPVSQYAISWQGWDWDGGGETTLTLNGQILASLPTNDSPQNAGNWAAFTLYTDSLVSGVNTLTFTHANSDCGVSDNVSYLQVTGSFTTVYSNYTTLPLDCNHSITYTFTD